MSKSKSLGLNPLSSKKGELRQDLITGKWVAIAHGRSQRHQNKTDVNKKPKTSPKYQDNCPFCNLTQFPQEPDILRLPDNPDTWQIHVFANKYPAFIPATELRSRFEGPYRAIEAVGYHEVLATRWHNQTEAEMTISELSLVLEALVVRYRQLKTKQSVNYIQIIKNHGIEAGATQQHPHHQIFTTPVLPSEVSDILHGAERYSQKHGHDPYTDMISFELEAGTRIIWQNDDFVIFCPYASRVPFETWIMPRAPEPFFENLGPSQRESLAQAMHELFVRLDRGLNDPAFNYFIYSAPCDDTGFICNKESFGNFRWHIEVLPRFGSWGGFELATALEINPSVPEESAAFLRQVSVSGL